METTTIFFTLAMLSIIGFIAMIIYSSVLISRKDLQEKDNWTLKIFTPNTLSLSLFAVGIVGYYVSLENDNVNSDIFYKYLIPVVSILSIFFSSLVIILSSSLIYFKGD